ncbi:MAG: DUF1987 domain-containing protein [Bacteroidales bacterium]
MEKYVIDSTPNTPGIILDPMQHEFRFSGESRPENVRKFYMPVLEWLESYVNETLQDEAREGKPAFHFSFEYFNSTSAKFILDIFKLISRLNEARVEPTIRWYYEEDDEDMLEWGRRCPGCPVLPSIT